MKIRTLLIDSNYLLKRSFNGAKNTSTDAFGHIGGLYGYFTMVRKLIRDHKINKVVSCWDGENGGVYRYMIDRRYKANRKSKKWADKIELSEAEIRRENEKDQSILKQRKRIQAYIEELFIRQIEVDDIEADDLIAKYCLDNYESEDIYIYTNDRDFAQLFDKCDIKIIFANIGEPVTKYNYMLHFDHHYSNALTVKILEGDTADNIAGISLVKEKTLLKYFPELKFRYVSVNEIKNRSVEINEERISNKKKPIKALENIINGVERLKINYKLINLSQPILNEEAIEELNQLSVPLSSDGRSSKNLYKMMVEDQFLNIYNSNFVNYVEPFYTVIMHEKQLLKEYLRKR